MALLLIFANFLYFRFFLDVNIVVKNSELFEHWLKSKKSEKTNNIFLKLKALLKNEDISDETVHFLRKKSSFFA